MTTQTKTRSRAPGKLIQAVFPMVGMFLACVVLAIACLLLSYSNFSPDIFKGYFEHPMILVVNTLVAFALCMVLYTCIGRAWIAYLVTALVCLGIAIGNYYLIIIRCDPLQAEDILCLREALNITSTQSYELKISWRIVAAVAAGAACCVALGLIFRHGLSLKGRLLPLVVTGVLVCGTYWAVNTGTILRYCENYEYIDTWSSTQIYASRGVLYSFSRSALNLSSSKPDGYSEEKAEQYMAGYTDKDIPEERKVDIIVVMRESYNDLSDLGGTQTGVDWQTPYELYHKLAQESYTGRMVSNGFGGNTKDAERCFLTGSSEVPAYRRLANSYVWWLRRQGYTTEGAHPFNGWFYNRQNFNRYIGFENYYFKENLFGALSDEKAADDDILYEQILRLYNESSPDEPYFSFSVTFEGHGPYDYRGKDAQDNQYVLEGADTADGYALNDYLNCVRRRDEELMVLIDALRQSDRPVVVLTYGDHNATLGADINNYTTAAYDTYGINMDVSTEEGFYNYYTTEYLIWANDAAKEVLDFDFTGTGPTVSPCYLMNVLAECLGWEGNAHLQAMGDLMQTFPVISTKGIVSVEGKLVQQIDEAHTEQWRKFEYINYNWQHRFLYEELAE